MSVESSHTDELPLAQPPSAQVICPFCATLRPPTAGPCPRCTLADTPEARRAAVPRIGPWFVLQANTPAAPGMTYGRLVALVRSGTVTRASIVRGPTTQQLWARATQVRGISQLFGLCHHCGDFLSPDAASCPQCGQSQEPPADPDTYLEAAAPKAAPRPPARREEAKPRDRRVEKPTAPVAASTPRPMHSRPTNGKRSPDTILSPKDLAAAFALNLPEPEEIPKRRSARPPKPIFEQTETAAADGGNATRGVSAAGRRRRFAGAGAVVLLLGLGGAGLAAWFHAPTREMAWPYYEQARNWAGVHVASARAWMLTEDRPWRGEDEPSVAPPLARPAPVAPATAPARPATRPAERVTFPPLEPEPVPASHAPRAEIQVGPPPPRAH